MFSVAAGSRLERALAFFFGRDVFVSYCYKDSAYAEALAVALGQRKFSVFLGAWGASPGKDISERVTTAARQSRLLVVVATPHSRMSGPVEEEIRYFAARGKPLVPIDVGLGMSNPKEEWPAVAGTDVIRETGTTPSAEVLARIENAAKFMRQETRLRRFLAGTAVAVIALILGAMLWTGRLVRVAEQRRAEAEDRTAAAVRREDEAQAAAKRAVGEQQKAEMEKRAAEEDRDAAARGQREAAAAAEREAEIALAVRLANDATTVARQQPILLADAALMAVDAVRRLDRRGVRALAADDAIRATAGALPVILHRKDFTLPESNRVVASTDVRFILDRRRLALVDTTSGRTAPICVPPAAMVDHLVLSADGSTTAAAYRTNPGHAIVICRDRVALRNLALDEGALALALDSTGEHLAVTERRTNEVSTYIVKVTDGVELARLTRPDKTLERDLTFSASGDVLSLLGPSALVWPWKEGTTMYTAPVDIAPQQAFFHPTDRELIAFQDPGLQIWRWRDWKPGAAPVWSTPTYVSSERGGAAFSSDGQWIAASSRSTLVMARWREERNATLVPLPGESRTVAVENGKVAIGFRDGFAELRSPAEDAVARIAHGGEVVAVAFTSAGAVRSVSNSGAMTWRADAVDSRLTRTEVDDVAVSRDGSSVVTVVSKALGARNHALYVYRDGRELGPYGGAKFQSVVFDVNGGLFAGTRDDQLLHWNSLADLEAGKEPEIIMGVHPPVAISPSGAHQAWIDAPIRRRSAAGRMEISSDVIVAAANGKRFHLPHPGGARAIAFGSDSLLVTASGDGKVRVWKWRDDAKRPAAVFIRPDTSFVAASRDDRWVAATGGDGEAVVWSTSGPQTPAATFPSRMPMIAFDPTAASVLTADADGIARVWSPWRDSRVEIARFAAPPRVDVARFSADGRFLVTASRFDGVRRRRWSDVEMADEACRRLAGTGLRRYGAVCRATDAP
jgi:WD40 repeat protein